LGEGIRSLVRALGCNQCPSVATRVAIDFSPSKSSFPILLASDLRLFPQHHYLIVDPCARGERRSQEWLCYPIPMRTGTRQSSTSTFGESLSARSFASGWWLVARSAHGQDGHA